MLKKILFLAITVSVSSLIQTSAMEPMPPEKKKGLVEKFKEKVGYGKKESKENKESAEKEPALKISFNDITITCPTVAELGNDLKNVKRSNREMSFTNSEGVIFKATQANSRGNIVRYISDPDGPKDLGKPDTQFMGVWSDKTKGKIQCAYSVYFKDRPQMWAGRKEDVLLLDVDFEKMDIKPTDVVFPNGKGDVKLDEVASYLGNQSQVFASTLNYTELWWNPTSPTEVFHNSMTNVKFIIPKTDMVTIDDRTPGILVFAHTAQSTKEYMDYGQKPLSCDLLLAETPKETFVIGQNDNIVDHKGNPAQCTIELIKVEDPSKRYSVKMPNMLGFYNPEKGNKEQLKVYPQNVKPEPGNYVVVVKSSNAQIKWGTGPYQAICSVPK